MKIIKFSELFFQPASHEDPKNPGVLKKVLLKHNDLTPGQIQMINWARLPVGKSFRSHYHEDMEEIFVMLSGNAEIRIDAEIEVIIKGDVVIIPKKAKHIMTNNGDRDVEYLAIGITPQGQGKTIVA